MRRAVNVNGASVEFGEELYGVNEGECEVEIYYRFFCDTWLIFIG